MKLLATIARSPLAWLLFAALGVRLAAGLWWVARQPAGMKFSFADSESYWDLAGAIARGAPYEFGQPPARAFRTPGYPLILSPLFVAYGHEPPIAAAHVLNAVLGTCAACGVYLLGERLFDRRTGLTAAALTAFYPGAIALSVFVLSEAAFCPLMVAQLVVLAAAWQATDACHASADSAATLLPSGASPPATLRSRSLLGASLLAVAAGALGGATTLVRPSWLLFTPFASVLALLPSGSRAARALAGAAMLAGLVVVMAPWWVRNYRQLGEFVPTTTEVGASLYDGLSPRATGASDMSFRDEFIAVEAQQPADERSLECRLDRRMRDAALAWAFAHPAQALRLAGVKLTRLWNVWPNEPAFRSVPLRLIVAATYLPLLILGLFGALRFTAASYVRLLCWLPAVYITLLHTVFVSSIRYREPVMLPLAVAAAATLVYRRKDASDS